MSFATEDQEISAFLKAYSKIPIGARPKVPWEAISLAAKVNPKHLYGAIRVAIENHCWNRSRLIAISNHPDVMGKRVEFAKMAGGEKDRMAMDIYNGFLASPKGATINVNQQIASLSGSRKNEDEASDPKTIVYEGTDVEERLFGGDDILDNKMIKVRQRQLEG